MTRRLSISVVFVLVALACAGFVRLNGAAARIDLYFGSVSPSVGKALVAAFVLGWGAGLAGALAWIGRLARERVQLERALRLAEGEIRTLRAIAPAHAR
jgi:hypothetical protein